MTDDLQKDSGVENASAKILDLTWEEHKRLCVALAEKIDPAKYDSVFPVLRGGLCPAVELAALLNLPVVWEISEKSLVVDDVCDSGATIAKYLEKGYDVAVLHFKNRSVAPTFYAEETCQWIVYPWESDRGLDSIVTRQIEYVGDNPNRPGLAGLAERVVEGWGKIFRGYKTDLTAVLSARAEEDKVGSSERLARQDFEFYSTSEESGLPFFGMVTVGWFAGDERKESAELKTLVDCVTRRFQTQQQICEQIADAVDKAWSPRGVYVKAFASHSSLIVEGERFFSIQRATETTRGDASPLVEAMR